MKRCAVNLTGREEDCGGRVTYVPCRKPATWTVGPDSDHECPACEKHAMEALRDGFEVLQ